MISAGNDIVALQAVNQQRTHLPEFYSKFITPAELAIYEQSALPFTVFVWLLWSVKESAYKYLKRGEASLVFSPSKIIIQQVIRAKYPFAFTYLSLPPGNTAPLNLTGEFCFFMGEVEYNSQPLYFQSVINDDFIATVVNDDENFNEIYWGVQAIDKPDYESQSKAVRFFVLDKLNSLLSLNNLLIEKHPIGYPVLYNGTQQTGVPISFAHHHRYVSYSFQISK